MYSLLFFYPGEENDWAHFKSIFQTGVITEMFQNMHQSTIIKTSEYLTTKIECVFYTNRPAPTVCPVGHIKIYSAQDDQNKICVPNVQLHYNCNHLTVAINFTNSYHNQVQYSNRKVRIEWKPCHENREYSLTPYCVIDREPVTWEKWKACMPSRKSKSRLPASSIM